MLASFETEFCFGFHALLLILGEISYLSRKETNFKSPSKLLKQDREQH